ncbi:TetR/AcrR family transcriptional regulator [Acidovorax sp. SRB_24]|uniref:TetR/AcrR family transcriptional regulator n=1 Tax=Acidovorax sp. SRB_24 TaxID=1962700 RepID=UPI00145FB66C|nr:TetR/AcrR family transcriptional regulator [Acidovorax sp. SRB_24]
MPKKSRTLPLPPAGAAPVAAADASPVPRTRPARGPRAGALAAPEAAPARPRGRPRKTDSDLDEGNRRRLVIEGAARLFRTQGFDATSTRDIAAAAGMRSGSPFYHFESKNALLCVVMQEGMAQATHSQQAALQRLPAGASARERLRALVRNHFEVLLGPNADFIPVMLYEWRSLNDGQRQDIDLVKDAYEDEWMPVLQALHAEGSLKANPATARLFIFGALNWSVQWFNARGALSIDGLTEQALALFIGDA